MGNHNFDASSQEFNTRVHNRIKPILNSETYGKRNIFLKLKKKHSFTDNLGVAQVLGEVVLSHNKNTP